jgi:hypothetical protein
LATGYLDPLPEGGGQRRTQVIIVVTDGWSVLCYNHELRLMWESNPRSDMFSSYYLKYVVFTRSLVASFADLLTNSNLLGR